LVRTDGRTDRQGESYIPPQTSFAGGIITTSAMKLVLSTTSCEMF